MGIFHTIVILVGTLVIAVTLAFSLIQRTNVNLPGYLKNFYVYPLFILLISLNTLTFAIFPIYKVAFAISIEKTFVLVDFIFWGLFFLYLLKVNSSRKFIKFLNNIFFIMLVVILSLVCFSTNPYQPLGYANLGKCIFCICYFHNLFRNLPDLNLRGQPSFWIVSGLLFYSTISTPIYLSMDLFFYNHYDDLIGILFPLTNIAIIVMHLLFLKGYLCTIQRQKI
jgi:hypothetical protein